MRVKVKMKGPLASRHGKDYACDVNQELLPMLSCEPPAALNVLLWPVVTQKNRVGGSPVFSFVFAFQYIGQTLDTPDENGGYGYDFASGVHKYLYAADNPVNMVDPSGNDYGDFDLGLNGIYIPLALVGYNVAQDITGSASVQVHFKYLGKALGKNYYHASIVLYGPGGLTYGFRGGPSPNGGNGRGDSPVLLDYSFLQSHGKDMDYGYISDAGSGRLYDSTWVDYYPHSLMDNAGYSVPVGSESFSQLYVGFMKAATYIDSLHITYHPVRQNSNSFAKTLLVKNGLPAPRENPV
jgi:hypothetical protein